MDSSFWWIDTINLEWPIVYTEGSQIIISKRNFISLKIIVVLANIYSVDTDEMLHYASCHQLYLHCLPNRYNAFR